MIKGLILDLDGTVYLGNTAVPDASRFVASMRGKGRRCLFVTNRANRTPEEICSHLHNLDISCSVHEVLTSAEATALSLGKGSFYCIGEEGLRRALFDAGHTSDDTNPDYVIVGFDREFTYAKLAKACTLIDAGARFIATNPDKSLKTPDGLVPGTGTIVAAVAAGCGKTPEIIGKPERRIIDIAMERLHMCPDEVVMIGDNLATDIPAGAAAGLRTALILTGISKREEVETATIKPTWVVENFDRMEKILEQDTR